MKFILAPNSFLNEYYLRMNLGPQVYFPRDVAPWLDGTPGVHLVSDQTARLEVEGQPPLPLSLLRRTSILPPSVAVGAVVHVASRFSPSERQDMEKLGLSYVDTVGHLHLSFRDVLVHIERPSRTRWPTVTGADPLGSPLGPASMRVAFAMLDSPKELSVPSLSAKAGVSAGQTHLMLKRLEDAGLVERSGRGPHTERTLKNRTQLLDLLQAQFIRQRRIPIRRAYVYARRPEELWRHVAQALGPRAAISGAAGATLLAGPAVGLTAVQRTLVRISPEFAMDEVFQALEAKAADAGANVLLMPDRGGLGTTTGREVDGVRVAPPVCVYLDCLREPRGEDLARQFREAAIGY